MMGSKKTNHEVEFTIKFNAEKEIEGILRESVVWMRNRYVDDLKDLVRTSFSNQLKSSTANPASKESFLIKSIQENLGKDFTINEVSTLSDELRVELLKSIGQYIDMYKMKDLFENKVDSIIVAEFDKYMASGEIQSEIQKTFTKFVCTNFEKHLHTMARNGSHD
jgi:hypothetical protein